MFPMINTPRAFQRLIACMLAVLMTVTVISCCINYQELEEIVDDWPPLGGDSIDVTGTVNYGAGQDVLELVNALREEAGVSTVKLDKDLTNAAVQRAAEISLVFSHTRPDGSSCFSVSGKSYAENIAFGYTNASGVFGGWKGSSGHLANMVRDGYQSMGIGSFTNSEGTYWVQLFGYGKGSGDSRTSKSSKTITVSLRQTKQEEDSHAESSGSGKTYEAPSIGSAKANGSLGMKVTWTASENITTYQFSYKADKSDDWTTIKLSNIMSGKQTTALSDMPAAGKYTVRVRGVYEENGETKYTQWSKTKSVKVKK